MKGKDKLVDTTITESTIGEIVKAHQTRGYSFGKAIESVKERELYMEEGIEERSEIEIEPAFLLQTNNKKTKSYFCTNESLLVFLTFVALALFLVLTFFPLNLFE